MADIRRKTAQLFDKNSVEIYEHSSLGTTNSWAYDTTATGKTIRIPCEAGAQYTLSIDNTLGNTVFRIAAIESENAPVSGQSGQIPCITLFNDGTASQATVTSSSNAKYLIIQFSSAILTDCIDSLMMNTGTTALPYAPYWPHSLKKFDGTVWQDATVHEF